MSVAILIGVLVLYIAFGAPSMAAADQAVDDAKEAAGDSSIGLWDVLAVVLKLVLYGLLALILFILVGLGGML